MSKKWPSLGWWRFGTVFGRFQRSLQSCLGNRQCRQTNRKTFYENRHIIRWIYWLGRILLLHAIRICRKRSCQSTSDGSSIWITSKLSRVPWTVRAPLDLSFEYEIPFGLKIYIKILIQISFWLIQFLFENNM